ncbi:MAG: Wzy polymerase domain-containing protein [Alphaproteobacteria bacterium]|nr:Wzy polymerase domain-containing protein [Alphaproteobacteria bacterium]
MRVAGYYYCFFALLCVASFGVMQWTFPSLGDYLVPRNFLGWSVLIGITSIGLIYAAQKGEIKWQAFWLWGIVPPVYLLLRFMLFGSALPESTATSILALCGFWLFFIALMQLRLQPKDWDKLYFIILTGIGFATLISFFRGEFFGYAEGLSWLPQEMRFAYAGFQQANLMASFFATLLIWALVRDVVCAVRRKRESKKWQIWGVRALLLLLFTALFKSGSQAGLVGLLGGGIVASLTAYYIKPHLIKSIFTWWFILIAGFLLSNLLPILLGMLANIINLRGWGGDMDIKPSLLHELHMSYNAALQKQPVRLSAWFVCWQLFLQMPISGHGLGMFAEQFHNAFQTHNIAGGLQLVPNFTHPHNEVLYILVEQGLIGLVFILAPWVYMSWRLIAQTAWRGLFLPALIAPIGLHTLVEFPLYLSGFHWLLLGFITVWAVGNRGARKPFMTALPAIGRVGIVIVPTIIFLIVTIEGAWIAHKAWRNVAYIHYPNFQSFLIHSQTRRELWHPLLGRRLSMIHTQIIAEQALTHNFTNLLRTTLPSIEESRAYSENKHLWTLLARTYKRLGEGEKLAAHMQRVKAFDEAHYILLNKTWLNDVWVEAQLNKQLNNMSNPNPSNKRNRKTHQ